MCTAVLWSVVSQLAAVSGVGAAAKPGIGPVSSFGSGSPPEGVVSLQQCWRWNWSWAGGRHSVQQLVAVGSSRSSCVLGSWALSLVPVASRPAWLWGPCLPLGLSLPLLLYFVLQTMSAYGSARGSGACVGLVSRAFHVCIARSARHCMLACVSCACAVWAAHSVALCLVHVACCLNSCATGGLLIV